MPANCDNFAPELYRGQLLFLAKKQWGDVLQAWGEPSDLVQQTLLDAHKERGEFKGKTVAEFVDWLRTIMLRNTFDVIRSMRRKMRDCKRNTSLTQFERSSACFGLNLAYDDLSPSGLAMREEQLTRMSQILDQLPPPQRQAITLRHFWGLTSEETAEAMGRSKDAVSGLLRRGLRTLREQMQRGAE